MVWALEGAENPALLFSVDTINWNLQRKWQHKPWTLSAISSFGSLVNLLFDATNRLVSGSQNCVSIFFLSGGVSPTRTTGRGIRGKNGVGLR